MPSPLPEPSQVRVDALRTFHADVVRALAETAPQGGNPSELAASGMSLRCEQCGFQVTGPEWAAIVQADDPSTLGDARLARLHQGYCARKDCNSYYYRVVFAETPGVDWARVLARAVEAPAPPPPEPKADQPRRDAGLSRRQLTLRLAIGIAAVALLLLIRRLWTGGAIPVLRPATKYTVDPSSIPQAPSPPASTNAP